MKTVIYQEVTKEIDERLKKFDEIRILKNTSNFHKFSISNKQENIVAKNNKNEVIIVEKIVENEILLENDKNEILVKEKAIDLEIVNKNSNLKIVTDEIINQNIVKKEISEIDKAKLANFKKNDDFFLSEMGKDIEIPKKGTPNFFKAISGFFADITKDQVVQEKLKSEVKLKPQRNEIIEKTSKPFSEPKINQPLIADEEAIKAEKLRIIEEEFRQKAEKREADEKLLLEQQEADLKKSNADFRKNKRKK